MKRLSGVILVLVLTVLCSTAMAQTFPTVTYEGFDPNTYKYSYRIDCPADSTFPFGQFIVQAEVANFGVYATWILDADTDPSTRWLKSTQTREWTGTGEPLKANAKWRAATYNDVVPANTSWTGRFFLTVPNSSPTGGIVVTMDGGPASSNPVEAYVPGPGAPVPEPSSVLALGMLAGGLIPFVRRRR